MIISSKTNWWISIISVFPFLITFALGEATIDSLSTTFFEWISCIVLIAVFIITISKNNIFLYDFTHNIHIANIIFIILNSVKKFSYIILFMLLVGIVVSWFTKSSSILFFTWSVVKPISMFGLYLSTFFNFIIFLFTFKIILIFIL